MMRHIKNIFLISFSLLYVSTSSVLLLVTVTSSARSNYQVLSKSNPGKPLPCHEKTWIERKHIPLTVKVSGISAIETGKYILPAPFVHGTPLISESEQIYLDNSNRIIQNKAPPISTYLYQDNS